MAAIADIISDLVDEKISLTSALLKTKVLAHKLNNKQLANWINNELNGYEGFDVPPYRKMKCQIMGTFSDGLKLFKNAPVPIGNLDSKIQEPLKMAVLKNSVSNIEDFLRQPENPSMAFIIPPEICNQLSNYVGYDIMVANKELDRTQLVQLLTNVRSKLLEFLMELKHEVGDVEFMDDKKIDDDKVDRLFNASIIGDGNVFLVGDYNYQSAQITINKGDLEKLRETFLKAGLSEQDVNELEDAINCDKPDVVKKTFGGKVKNWIGKMFNKSLDGSWEISTGAAGTLLAEAIKKFYGF